MKFSEHLCWVIICNAVVKVSKGLSFISMLKVNFYQAQKHKAMMGYLRLISISIIITYHIIMERLFKEIERHNDDCPSPNTFICPVFTFS